MCESVEGVGKIYLQYCWAPSCQLVTSMKKRDFLSLLELGHFFFCPWTSELWALQPLDSKIYTSTLPLQPPPQPPGNQAFDLQLRITPLASLVLRLSELDSVTLPALQGLQLADSLL